MAFTMSMALLVRRLHGMHSEDATLECFVKDYADVFKPRRDPTLRSAALDYISKTYKVDTHALIQAYREDNCVHFDELAEWLQDDTYSMADILRYLRDETAELVGTQHEPIRADVDTAAARAPRASCANGLGDAD